MNPKIVTQIPGPGSHDPDDLYTTKEHSSKKWSINKIERDPTKTEIKHPGPHEYSIPSKIVEKPEYGFGLKPFIDPQKCRTKTGPADYNPYPEFAKNDNPKFHIMGRPANNMTFNTPGSGSYEDMR